MSASPVILLLMLLSLPFLAFCVYGFFNTPKVIYLWQKLLFDWESPRFRPLYREASQTYTIPFARRFLLSVQRGPEVLARNHPLYVEATRFLFFLMAVVLLLTWAAVVLAA